jgi:hypothetical protein
VFLDLMRAMICDRVSGWRLLRGGILGTVVGMFMMRWSDLDPMLRARVRCLQGRQVGDRGKRLSTSQLEGGRRA